MRIFFTFLYNLVNFVRILLLCDPPNVLISQFSTCCTIFQHVHLSCCKCAPAQRRSSATLRNSALHSGGHPDMQAAVVVQGVQLSQAGFHRFFSAALSDTPVQAFAAGKHVLHEPARSHVTASSIHLPVGPERLYDFFSVFPLFQADADMPSMPSYHQTISDMPRPVPADTFRFF